MDSRNNEEKTCLTRLKKTLSSAAVGATASTALSLAGYALLCRLFMLVWREDNVDTAAWLEWLLISVPKSAVEHNIPQVAGIIGGLYGAGLGFLESGVNNDSKKEKDNSPMMVSPLANKKR